METFTSLSIDIIRLPWNEFSLSLLEPGTIVSIFEYHWTGEKPSISILIKGSLRPSVWFAREAMFSNFVKHLVLRSFVVCQGVVC